MSGPIGTEINGIIDVTEPTTGTAFGRIDGWIAASVMQKAIRRGDVEVAVRAGDRLLQLRGAAAFNRLVITAFEDIGIGSEGAIASAVMAGADPQHRRAIGGNEQAMAQVIEELSRAPKDRSADYLICGAKAHPSLECTREDVGCMTLANRIALAADLDAPIPQRAVAAWYASGLEWGDEKRVGAGDIQNLLKAFAVIGVSQALLSATAIAARRTKEPIVVMVPVLSSALQQCASPTVSELTLLLSPLLEGIPLYAFGHHTRIGKQAIRRFVRECTAVRNVLEKHVPDYKAAAVGEMAVYYADAAPISRKLMWQHSQELERLGRESDFIRAGAPFASVQDISETVLANLDYLNQIRGQLFRAIL
jgi:hypothetical protein